MFDGFQKSRLQLGLHRRALPVAGGGCPGSPKGLMPGEELGPRSILRLQELGDLSVKSLPIPAQQGFIGGVA